MVVSISCKCRHSQRLFLPYLIFAALTASLLQGAMAQTTNSTDIRLQDPNVIISSSNGTTIVYSPLTGDEIPQGLATDGSGSGFSLNAILWIVFSFTLGVPLMLAGFRGWRLTTGAAIGLSVSLACKQQPVIYPFKIPNSFTAWSVFVNTLDNVGISDIILTVLVLVLFALGFLFGLLEMSRMAGILQLGIQGGLTIGIRIVLLRNLLLVPNATAFFVNWLLIAFCGLVCAILVIWKQRVGLVRIDLLLHDVPILT